jgi:hypothetical protein
MTVAPADGSLGRLLLKLARIVEYPGRDLYAVSCATKCGDYDIGGLFASHISTTQDWSRGGAGERPLVQRRSSGGAAEEGF